MKKINRDFLNGYLKCLEDNNIKMLEQRKIKQWFAALDCDWGYYAEMRLKEKEKAIPFLERKKNREETDICLFCGNTHIHGSSSGHRAPHCSGKFILSEIIHKDKTKCYQENGYFIVNV